MLIKVPYGTCYAVRVHALHYTLSSLIMRQLLAAGVALAYLAVTLTVITLGARQTNPRRLTKRVLILMITGILLTAVSAAITLTIWFANFHR